MRKNEVRTRKRKIDEGEMRSAGKYLEKRWNEIKKEEGEGSWRRKWWQREIG